MLLFDNTLLNKVYLAILIGIDLRLTTYQMSIVKHYRIKGIIYKFQSL